ncbi:hypothetical protein ACVR0S_08570 [Streptococcus dentapri]|uniref:Cell wall-active antibiotics response LiaF-like C-terminal domain-containing protein n=1 Tax=Streptococcus dentapri TaxID=573564 RepID=A0ABV8D376_9STRE
MKRYSIWTFALLLLAAYFIVSAFVPNLHLVFNFDLVFALFCLIIGLPNRNIFMAFLGLAFLSNYVHDLANLNYSEWTLFVGILLLGIVVNQVFKPKRPVSKFYISKKGQTSYADDEREVYAKTFFSENSYYITSQNLDRVYADAKFGELNIDLCQAQFMTDSPEINIQVNFGEANIRIPRNWRINDNHLSRPFASLEIRGSHLSDEKDITVKLKGNVAFGQVNIIY